jgi:hypothetical protein
MVDVVAVLTDLEAATRCKISPGNKSLRLESQIGLNYLS